MALNYRLSAQDIGLILEHSGARFLFVDHEFEHLAEGARVELPPRGLRRPGPGTVRRDHVHIQVDLVPGLGESHVSEPRALGDLTSKKGWVTIAFDQSAWIPVLPSYPDGDDWRSYSAGTAQEWWQASGLRHTPLDVLRLFHLLVETHEGTYGPIPCHLAFAHLPDPRQLPLLLHVGV